MYILHKPTPCLKHLVSKFIIHINIEITNLYKKIYDEGLQCQPYSARVVSHRDCSQSNDRKEQLPVDLHHGQCLHVLTYITTYYLDCVFIVRGSLTNLGTCHTEELVVSNVQLQQPLQ